MERKELVVLSDKALLGSQSFFGEVCRNFLPTLSRQSGTFLRLKEFRAPRFTLDGDKREPQSFTELVSVVVKLCEHREPPSERIS